MQEERAEWNCKLQQLGFQVKTAALAQGEGRGSRDMTMEARTVTALMDPGGTRRM